ncbi:hypothetical protein [Euzebya sp.]|uniref:hypothetical protein n=1 Tax=Euzebya sp. TaxID=1971409 RepID=UPI003518D784
MEDVDVDGVAGREIVVVGDGDHSSGVAGPPASPLRLVGLDPLDGGCAGVVVQVRVERGDAVGDLFRPRPVTGVGASQFGELPHRVT